VTPVLDRFLLGDRNDANARAPWLLSRHVIRPSTPMAPTRSLGLFATASVPDDWRRTYRRVSGPLVKLARSAILSIALRQPCSASFMAFDVAALCRRPQKCIFLRIVALS
jgi:hypothetical protein